MADARRARRHAQLGVLLEFDHVEIITAVLGGGRFGQRGLGAGENRRAGRQGERLLRAGNHHVNAQRVKLQLDRRHRTDGVHDEHHVGIFFLERGDFGDRAHRAGRGFVVNHRQRVELAGGEFLVHGLGADGRAPRHLQRLGVLAAALRHVEPFVRERAVHAVQDFFGDEIPDRAFHHAPGGRGGDIDLLLRVKQLLELRLDFRVEVFEPLSAMTDHRRAKCLERFFAYFNRSRYV